MKRLVAALALLVGWAPAARPVEPVVLTSLHSIRALSHAEANRELQVDFEATVTYFRGYEKTLFVQDGDSAMYVRATTDLPLVVGDRIRVRGTTQDSFSPIVSSDNLVLLHHGAPPPPVQANFHSLINGELDCKYVTVHGFVVGTNMSLSSGHSVTRLDLRLDGGAATVYMDNSDPNLLKGLLDAEVRVTGVAAERFDGKMQQTGAEFHVASFEQIAILRRAAVDAWSLPITPMNEVLRGFNVEDRTPRVRVQGTLTYYRQMSMAVLQDGDKSLRVLTPQIDPLRVGDRVEALGIPFVDNGFLTLKEGKIRSMGPAPALAPRPVNWTEMVSGKYGFDLVSMEGIVLSQVREHAQDVYIISTEGHLFSATVRHPFVYEWNAPWDPPPMPEIRPGSKVRVSGVAILDEGNPFNGAMAFGILLRTADDVAVLEPAPWMNVQNLSRIVSVLLLIVVVIGSWGMVMRRNVHRQAVALSKRIEAEAVLERRRSRVLEDINGRKPLPEILKQIAELVSFNLNDAYCWLQIANGTPVGILPPETEQTKTLCHEIKSQSGSSHGTLYVAFDPKRPSVFNAVETLSMGARLAALAIDTRGLYSDLVRRSEFDLLTDVHNRFSLERQVDQLIGQMSQSHGTFGLIYIDLDKFKQVNDLYGHRIGDLYLQTVSQRMKRQLRPGDLLARLGGDEFAALVPVCWSRAEVDEIAQRMERCFDEPCSLEGCILRGSASVGFAVFPEDGTNRDELLSAADAAMYAAKHKGRQVVEISAREEAPSAPPSTVHAVVK